MLDLMEKYNMSSQMSSFIDYVIRRVEGDDIYYLETGFDLLDNKIQMVADENTYVMVASEESVYSTGFLTSVLVNLIRRGRHNLIRSSIKCFTDGYVFRDPVRS